MSNHNPALESIQFQKTDLFVGITNCIKDIRKMKPDVPGKIYYGSAQVNQLSAVIKKYTGILFDFEDSARGPGVYVPRLDQTIFDDSVMLEMRQIENSYFDINYDLKRILAVLDKDILDGTVDLKNAKVTGVFSNIKCKMFLPRSHLYWGKFSDEELAATILHEIGHVFISFEYLTRCSTNNQSLAIMLRMMDKSVNFEDRKIIFSKVKDKLKIDDSSYKLIEKENDPKIVTTVVVNDAIRRSKSELGASVYDMTSCEYLADQFATRHGAGKYIVTFLDKLGPLNDKMGVVDYFSTIYVKVIMLSIAVLPVAGFTLASFVGLFSFITFLYTSIGLSSINSQKEVFSDYDNDYMRFSRIKHQMIQRLKDTSISIDEKKILLNHIQEIDPIIKKNISDTNVKLRNRIAMFFNSQHKRDFEYMSLQKDLELIGNNDLYLMSEKLKLI